jgi:hypothetical protein
MNNVGKWVGKLQAFFTGETGAKVIRLLADVWSLLKGRK